MISNSFFLVVVVVFRCVEKNIVCVAALMVSINFSWWRLCITK